MAATALQYRFATRRAVLISGGLDTFHNYPRFVNDLRILYDCLVNGYGVATSDIQVLYANGGTYEMGGKQVVTQYCNKANVQAALRAAVAGLTPQDFLLIATSNHGQATNPHALLLWGATEKITATELGAELAGQPDYHLLGVFGECYGADMFLQVTNALPAATKKKTVLVAASTGPSYLLPPAGGYDAFYYYFTAALRGQTPSGYSVDADAKADTHVDVQEAFDHAKAMDKTKDVPDLQDASPALAGRMTLAGVLP